VNVKTFIYIPPKKKDGDPICVDLGKYDQSKRENCQVCDHAQKIMHDDWIRNLFGDEK